MRLKRAMRCNVTTCQKFNRPLYLNFTKMVNNFNYNGMSFDIQIGDFLPKPQFPQVPFMAHVSCTYEGKMFTSTAPLIDQYLNDDIKMMLCRHCLWQNGRMDLW